MENESDMTWKQAGRAVIPWILGVFVLPVVLAAIVAIGVGLGSFMLYQQPISMTELGIIAVLSLSLSFFPSVILIGYFSGKKHRSWKLPAIVCGFYVALNVAGGVFFFVWFVFFAKLPGP